MSYANVWFLSGPPSAISDAMAVSTIDEAMETTEEAVWISGAIVLMS